MIPSKVFHSLGLVISALIVTQALQAQAPQPQPPEERENHPLPTLLKAKPIKVDKNDDELKRLLKERYNEAFAETALEYQSYLLGRGAIDSVQRAGKRLLRAGLELLETPEEQVALAGQYVEVMKEVEKLMDARYRAGRVGQGDLHCARYYRLDAEIRLLRLKKKMK